MPVQISFLGARSRRFRQPRVLIVGCGDVGMRIAKALPKHIRILVTTSNPQRVAQLRAQGLMPLLVNLDQPASLHRLAGLTHFIFHLAPPVGDCLEDSRTMHLLASLRLRTKPKTLIYASTTGVYGNCQGQWVAETRPVAPQTDRAKRRVHAENAVRVFGKQSHVRVSSLRIPGIYAADRSGGDLLERLRQAIPVLLPEDDVYTNHIHADQLACVCIAALWRAKPQRHYNVAEDIDMKMGDYYDALADATALPKPPRMSKTEAQEALSPMRLSFLRESRRIDNTRMKQELRAGAAAISYLTKLTQFVG